MPEPEEMLRIVLYMFYNTDTGKAYLWQYSRRVDIDAMNKAKEHLEKGQSGRLFVGPTGHDEMRFVDTVKRRK